MSLLKCYQNVPFNPFATMIPRFIALIFLFYLISSFTSEDNRPLKIAIISVDNEIRDAKKITKFLASYYNCKVDILPAISAPKECYRNQSDTLLGSKVLTYLDTTFKDSAYDKYMALTEKPIYLNEGFPFIRGLAVHNGNSYMVSTHKIKKEAGSDKRLYKTLLEVVSRHEVGHTLGLRHCEYKLNCLMRSGVIDTIFFKIQPVLCDSCSNQLKSYLK